MRDRSACLPFIFSLYKTKIPIQKVGSLLYFAYIKVYKIKVMDVLRFNRHDIFDGEDRSLVLNIIDKVDRLDYDGIGHETANMLYGLFDGYWYSSLQSNIESISTVPNDMIDKLNKLLNRVQAYIDVNGVTYTSI